MLGRLRRAFLPRDPIYRRESGAGSRTILVAKALGACVVVLSYLFWTIMALSGRDEGAIPVAVTTVASYFFCLLAFVLGLHATRGEVTDGTAEALVMTPIDRRRLVASKLAGSVEFVVVAALLLPIYCCTLVSIPGGLHIRAMLHGGMFRLWALTEGHWGFQFHYGEHSFAVDVLTGAFAFLADLSWYLMLAACGAWAAVSRRPTFVVWVRGLAIGGLVLVGLSLVEWVGFDFHGLSEAVSDCFTSSNLRSAYTGLLNYNPFFASPWSPPDTSTAWTVAWITASVGLRLLVGWLFLARAARRFDLIATD